MVGFKSLKSTPSWWFDKKSCQDVPASGTEHKIRHQIKRLTISTKQKQKKKKNWRGKRWVRKFRRIIRGGCCCYYDPHTINIRGTLIQKNAINRLQSANTIPTRLHRLIISESIGFLYRFFPDASGQTRGFYRLLIDFSKIFRHSWRVSFLSAFISICSWLSRDISSSSSKDSGGLSDRVVGISNDSCQYANVWVVECSVA